MDACPHTEHRSDRATGRTIGYDPRVNEWGPCTNPTPARSGK